MKRCHSLAADIDGLAAGILPPEQARVVEAHLGGCPACRERYERTVALCAELSTAGRTTEVPDVAAWRLRNRVHAAITSPASGVRWRWQTATALAAGCACGLWFNHRATPPVPSLRPAEITLCAPTVTDPPLTLLACERAAARSDAALDQLLVQKVTYPRAEFGGQTLRAFSPAAITALDHDDQLP